MYFLLLPCEAFVHVCPRLLPAVWPGCLVSLSEKLVLAWNYNKHSPSWASSPLPWFVFPEPCLQLTYCSSLYVACGCCVSPYIGPESTPSSRIFVSFTSVLSSQTGPDTGETHKFCCLTVFVSDVHNFQVNTCSQCWVKREEKTESPFGSQFLQPTFPCLRQVTRA